MFDAAVWGTVGQWVSGIGTSGAAITGLSVFMADLRRRRREQAASIVGWWERAVDQEYPITIQNLSDKPIFNMFLDIVAKEKKEFDYANDTATKLFGLEAPAPEMRDYHHGDWLFLGEQFSTAAVDRDH
jgi:hypothetical protein